MRELPKMIPWHLPELRAAREKLQHRMHSLAVDEARRDSAFRHFMQAALNGPTKRRKGRPTV